MPSARKPTRSEKPTKPTRQKRSAKRRFILLSLGGTIALFMLGVLIYVIVAAMGTPKWDPTGLQAKSNSTLLDKKGEQFAQLHLDENRIVLTSSQIPDLIKKTVVAVEDKRFYNHFGVDPIRIIGSAINDIRSRSAKEGASTITIQLARNAFIENPTEKTLSRKIQEAVLAIQLEHEYTKDEILTFYLNRIFFGQSSFGIQTAAITYFGKTDVNDLEPAEVALLVGLPQAPSQYNPYYKPDSAKNRRNIVLSIMRDAGIITEKEYATAKDTSFTYVESMKDSPGGAQNAAFAATDYKYPYFTDYVIEELESVYNLTPEQIYSGGLTIHTTVNPKIQLTAEEAFANSNNFPQGFDDVKVQGAMTVLDPSSGSIQAMVGGRDYTTRGLNRAWQSKRQPGSTIKPLVVYGPALEKGGYFPGTVFDDMPVSYGNYSPTNFDTIASGWKGLITMRYAVENSVNVYAVKLLNEIGVDYGWEFGKNKLGLPLTENDRNLTLALGSPTVTTVDMAAAYGIYANNGISVTPHAVERVLDSKGNELITPKITKIRVVKETTAYLINDLLRSAVTNGTGASAQIGNWAVAGKTGTTSLDPDYYGNKDGNPDAWFAGYTPNYVGIVWMGYDTDDDRQHYLRKVYGGTYPAQIWKQVMTAALEDHTVQTKFTMPSGIISGSFDRKSGLLPSSLTPSQFIGTEIAAEGDFPTQISNIWIQKEVDADDPSFLASEYSKDTITKTFLYLPNRNPAWTWPSNEVPYRPPYQSAPEKTDSPADPSANNNDPDQPTDNSSAGDKPSIPSPVLNNAVYSEETGNATISLNIPQGGDKYILVLSIQRPGKSPESRTFQNPKTSLIFSLKQNNEKPDSGDYVFWAAFKGPNDSDVGPSSNVIRLRIP